MFQLKKRILWVVQLIALASACWAPHNNIRTGTFQPITALTSNNSAPVNYVVPYNGTALLPPTLPQNFSYGLGLVGYQSYLTLAFSFNVAMTDINTTHLSLTIKVEDGSYLASLRMNYIVVSYYAGMANTFEVVSGCFKCLNISQDINISRGLGMRSEDFSQRSSLGNIPTLEYKVFLYSFNFSNYYGQTNYLKVTTVHNGLIGNYTHTVTTSEYNMVNYVCLSVITWNSNQNNFGNGFAATFRDYTLNLVNKTSIVDYYAGFDCDNLKFMGFSSISHSMGGKRVLGVHPQNYNNFRLDSSFDYNNFTLESTLTIFYFGSQTCNTSLLPLYAPSALDCVSSCPNPYYVNSSNTCVACPSYCALCDINNITNCTSCLPGSNRVNATCDCASGYFQYNPLNKTRPCQTCSDFMPFCVNCTNSTYCLNCSAGKYSVNGTCQCQQNTTKQTYLVNGVCLDFPGCLNASLITTGKYCDVCNTSANFRRPSTTNLTCVCISKYNNNATPTLCVPDCGDGQIFTEECDDGNNVDTDGCNSTCQVVPGWFCYMNTSTNASTCMQAQNGTSITYQYAQRIVGTNTALLFFSFQPAGKIIDPYVFKNAIVTNAPISTITPTYNSANSSITLLVAFKESLQGNPYNFTFSFNSSYSYYAKSITVLVTPEGINQQLIFQSYSIVVKTMQYTIMGTAFLGLGLGMVCAGVGYKLMGLQLILPMQAAFFAQFGMTNPPPYVSTLKNMKYTMGYNQLMPYEYQKFVGSNSKFAKFDFQIQMALNLNVMAGLLLLATVGLLIFQILYLYRYFKAQQFQKNNAPPPPPQSKKNIKGKKEEKEVFQVKQVGELGLALKQARERRNAYVNNFYFYLSGILAQQILFCFIIQNSQLAVNQFYLSEDVNIMAGYLCLLLMVGNLVFMVLQWGEKKDRRIITFQETRVIKYPIFLIFSCLMMPLAMAVCMSFSFSSYIASGLGALPVIGLIYYRPYRHEETKLNAFSAFINLAFPMVASGIYLVNSIMKLSQLGWVLSVGIIVFWQFVTETTTIIRMVKTIPWRDLPIFERCVKKRKRSDDRLLEKQKVDIEMTSMVKNSLKGDGQIIDWEERNKKEYESISQKPDNQDAEASDHNEEEDELAQLKRRLKKQIMMKKAH